MTNLQYHGELWPGDPEQSPLPPEQIPEEHFDNPLCARMATLWWSSEEPEISDTLEEAFALLTTEEKLKLAAYIEGAGIEDPCGEHTVAVWMPPTDLTVDENQVVRGVIGTLHDIEEAVLHNHAITEHFLENVDDEVYAAAHRWQGPDFANSFSISDESMRRYELAAQKRAVANPASAPLE